MLKIIGRCNIKHIMILLIKTMSGLNVSTYIVTSITARPVGLAVILAIMSVSTFITADTLYIYITLHNVSYVILNLILLSRLLNYFFSNLTIIKTIFG